MKNLMLVIAVLIAFGIGRWLPRKDAPPVSPVAEPSEREAETRALLQEAAEELKVASNDDERRQKTEILLEKIFKLFLIDVSLRLSSAAACPAAEPLPCTPAAPPAAAKTATAELGTIAAPEQKKNPKTEAEKRRRFEVRIIDAATPNAMKKALGKLSELDFDTGFKASTDLNAQQIQSLAGVYEGQAEFPDKGAWSARFELSVTGTSANGQSLYHSSMKLTRNGKISESSGDGDSLRGYSIGQGENAPLYIEVGQTTLVLYWSQAFDGFSGVVYEEAGQHTKKPTGRIHLERRGH